jgi:hypothetical protein
MQGTGVDGLTAYPYPGVNVFGTTGQVTTTTLPWLKNQPVFNLTYLTAATKQAPDFLQWCESTACRWRLHDGLLTATQRSLPSLCSVDLRPLQLALPTL